jgi:Na+/phosphate symporter
MKFQDFFKELAMHFCNHSTLLYANCMFYLKFIDEAEREKPLEIPENIADVNSFEISTDKINELVTTFKNTFKIDYEDGIQNIWVYNVKSINARAINAYYETIKNYLEKRGKQEIYEFHNYDWFRILYMLRQITSHGNNIFKKGLEFPDKRKESKGKIKSYPDTIQYKGISLMRRQKTEIVFNEIQLSNLLSDINYFFATNNDFNVGI